MERGQVPQISDLELFAGCTKSEVRRISSFTTLLHAAKGEVLFRQGDAAEEFIVVESGTVRLSRMTPDGAVTLAEVGPGEPLGAGALISGGEWTVTAVATTDVALFVSSVSEFRAITHIAPSIEDRIWQSALELEIQPAKLAA
jgi:CRP-like cAMP-binding protein